MEISFIIPVYNGEACVGKCIGEIRKWNKDERIEIIVIDDGSDDDTWNILNRAAKNDPRIKIIHIENSGQGIARNCGLQVASGKYVCFVDADDWVDVKAVYRLYKKAKETEADVTMGGYYRVEKAGTKQVHVPGSGYIRRKGRPDEVKRYHCVKTESAFGYVWNKLYRRKFLTDNHLAMDDIRKVNMEDFLFNLKVWSRGPVFYCMDCPVCYYVTEHPSTTRKPDSDVHTKSAAMIRELILYLEENGVLEENLDMVIPLTARTFCWSLIKNIPYEGKSLAALRRRACTFSEEEKISETLKNCRASMYLRELPSLPQRLFYTLCLRAVRRGKVEWVCMLFYLFYPVMKRYAASVLK